MVRIVIETDAAGGNDWPARPARPMRRRCRRLRRGTRRNGCRLVGSAGGCAEAVRPPALLTAAIEPPSAVAGRADSAKR